MEVRAVAHAGKGHAGGPGRGAEGLGRAVELLAGSPHLLRHLRARPQRRA